MIRALPFKRFRVPSYARVYYVLFRFQFDLTSCSHLASLCWLQPCTAQTIVSLTNMSENCWYCSVPYNQRWRRTSCGLPAEWAVRRIDQVLRLRPPRPAINDFTRMQVATDGSTTVRFSQQESHVTWIASACTHRDMPE